ncbi:MAG: glycosylhydrolase-like jelly roll fold domain-containing protein, partial [Candidatus Sulfotelmatobacter sp.]
PYVPLVRWFADGQHLVCDITPNKEKRVGWYRFKAPPGLAAVRINAKAHRIEAWIDGKPAPIGDNEIRLQSSVRTTSLVALRIEQEPGSYAGAVFTQPVAFECREGQMPLGNWSEFGLSTYSGAGIYQKSANLEKEHLKGKVLLDLGNVRSVAEVHVNGHSAGVRLARPFRFDITNFVKEGENKIQIKVVNTLANHMSTYPTHWINEGQTQSGLLGPVEIRFLSKVNLAATSVAAKND